jgi:antitoxin HigA-1
MKRGTGDSAAELTRQIHVPVNRVTGIVNAQRAITADTAVRLGPWFGTNPNLVQIFLIEEGRVSTKGTGGQGNFPSNVAMRFEHHGRY